jgi:hypothetical protein
MIYFNWQVPKLGFEWIHTTARPPMFSGTQQPEKSFYLVRTGGGESTNPPYDPFTETGLYRNFADTPATREGILDFANRYGWLGVGVNIDEPVPDEPNSYNLANGEPEETWYREIATMRHLIGLWENAGGSGHHTNKSWLSEFIHWKGPDKNGEDRHPFREVVYRAPAFGFAKHRPLMIFDERRDSERFSKSGDLVLPARYALVMRVDSKVAQYRCAPRLILEDPAKPPKLRLVPENLIGALWVQFQQAITGNRRYEQCQQCNGWFEIAAKREETKFCSNACRFRAYRERQKEARALHSRGLAPSVIAARLQCKADAVKRWISN